MTTPSRAANTSVPTGITKSMAYWLAGSVCVLVSGYACETRTALDSAYGRRYGCVGPVLGTGLAGYVLKLGVETQLRCQRRPCRRRRAPSRCAAAAPSGQRAACRPRHFRSHAGETRSARARSTCSGRPARRRCPCRARAAVPRAARTAARPAPPGSSCSCAGLPVRVHPDAVRVLVPIELLRVRDMRNRRERQQRARIAASLEGFEARADIRATVQEPSDTGQGSRSHNKRPGYRLSTSSTVACPDHRVRRCAHDIPAARIALKQYQDDPRDQRRAS